MMMSGLILTGNWKKLREQAQTHFSRLTASDLDQVDGNYELLVEALKIRYGMNDSSARRSVDEWLQKSAY